MLRSPVTTTFLNLTSILFLSSLVSKEQWTQLIIFILVKCFLYLVSITLHSPSILPTLHSFPSFSFSSSCLHLPSFSISWHVPSTGRRLLSNSLYPWLLSTPPKLQIHISNDLLDKRHTFICPIGISNIIYNTELFILMSLWAFFPTQYPPFSPNQISSPVFTVFVQNKT